jgi:hypothetical protein
VTVAALALLSLSARAVEEEALQELWKQHLAAGENHEDAIKLCRDYTAGHAGDPLLPVVRGFEEWHHLRAGRRSEALQMIVADAGGPAGPVQDGAKRLALGWLTRVDRDQVAAALQLCYRKQVAYPKSLDEMVTLLKLPPAGGPPMNDRFGKPWVYALTGFAKVAGFKDQKYSLQSPLLGDTSDFKAAVQLPYASRFVATPAQVVPAPGNTQAVRFNLGGSKVAVVGAGQAAGDLYVAYIGTAILVVCDYTHWKILPRP